MVAVPEVMPETTPVPPPTVATPVLLLVHVPPDVACVNVVVAPVQTLDDPPIAGGAAEIVTPTVVAAPHAGV